MSKTIWASDVLNIGSSISKIILDMRDAIIRLYSADTPAGSKAAAGNAVGLVGNGDDAFNKALSLFIAITQNPDELRSFEKFYSGPLSAVFSLPSKILDWKKEWDTLRFADLSKDLSTVVSEKQNFDTAVKNYEKWISDAHTANDRYNACLATCEEDNGPPQFPPLLMVSLPRNRSRPSCPRDRQA